MAAGTYNSWICLVCGYVHQGATAPDYCSVCGAPADDFQPHAAPASQVPAVPTRWICLICGYMHDGSNPPETCPLCGAGSEQFTSDDYGDPTASTGNASAMSFQHVVIVGAGIAGLSAAESIHSAAPAARITLINGEPDLPYYRLNLTRYLAGEVSREALIIHPAAWYEDHKIDLRNGARVTAISTSSKRVDLTDGTSLSYDRLVLAMGAHPFIPPINGSDLDGVFCLRTLADADAILSRTTAMPACVVIGGGVLGLEAAAALAKRGLCVKVLETFDWLMPRQLNRRASEILEKHLATLGIEVCKPVLTRALLGNRHVSGVELSDGRVIPAGLVLIAAGVRPETHLARKAGLTVNAGIVADDSLRTSTSDVFAAGDVAEHNGALYGIWAPAQFQGAIAGLNVSGSFALFGGVPRSNTLKVLGISMTSIGRIEPEDGSYRLVEQEKDHAFYHFLFRDGKLVGGILAGDTSAAAHLKHAIESKRDCSGLLAHDPTADDVLEFLAQ